MIIYVVIISLSLIIITFFLTRGNSSPYQGTLAERFRPLTHIEIKQRKPFIYHLNSKWTYECRLDLTKNLVSLWNAKDAVLKAFNEKKYSVEIALLLLRELMYEIGQKPRGFLKRMQYKMVYHKSFEDNVGDFIELFNSMLMYQTRLFFAQSAESDDVRSARGIYRDGWRSFIAGTDAWAKTYLEYFSECEYQKERARYEADRRKSIKPAKQGRLGKYGMRKH